MKPARSLRVEIAQKLRRNDVLWWTADPPPPPAAPPAPTPAAPPAAPLPTRTGRPPAAPANAPVPLPASVPPPPASPAPAAPAAPAASPTPPPPPPSPPRSADRLHPHRRRHPDALQPWIPADWAPDMNLRIQALGSLIQTDAVRVIPILREIALESPNAHEASRAVFVLAQSGRADAHSRWSKSPRAAVELVQIAAVRELGRFGGPKVAEELLQVYRQRQPAGEVPGRQLPRRALRDHRPDAHRRNRAGPEAPGDARSCVSARRVRASSCVRFYSRASPT